MKLTQIHSPHATSKSTDFDMTNSQILTNLIVRIQAPIKFRPLLDIMSD
jgi:hypothetical protein